jgi:hypothetical protein
VSVGGTGNSTALYVFSTPSQGPSDVAVERFVIPFSQAAPPGNFTLSGTSNDFGTATGQGQMFPPVTPTGVRPRYNHPLEPSPGATFLTVAPCTTNLLYPWVLNFGGYDTGLAIANTSADPYGTTPQVGTCTLNLYPTDTTTNQGVALAGPVSVTTSNVQAGSVWRATMSGTASFAGRAGYIIAVCRFQYGHGFGFITDNVGAAPGTAQGYLALVIPDPLVLGGTGTCPTAALGGRGAAPGGSCFFGAPPSGEALPQ